MKKNKPQPTHVPAHKKFDKKTAVIIASIILLSFILNTIGIKWGLTGYIPWHDDSIAGITTVREMPRLSGDWTYKYPPLQFMLNSVFYRPLLQKWQNNPVVVQAPNGQTARQTLDYDRMNTLIVIANFISAFMAAAVVLAVYRTAKTIFDGDKSAGIFAALTIAVCQLFVEFAHLGNVDMPATFWFALGVMFIVDAIYKNKWLCYILTGVCFALSVSTKDTMPNYIIGVAAAAAVMIFMNKLRQKRGVKNVFAALFDLKIIVAIAVFVFIYLIVNGVLTNPDVYMKRISIWLKGGRGVVGWDKDFTGQWPLLLRTLGILAGGFGWPLLGVIAASLIYCASKCKEKTLMAVLPLLGFYLIVTVNIRFVHDRYLLPTLGCLAFAAGKGVADWLRWKKLPLVCKAVPIAAVYALSLLYCVGLDLEMRNDSRYDAEKWFIKNTSRNAHIAVLCDIRWSPRLHLTNLNCSYRCTFRDIAGTAEDVLSRPPAYPRYVCVLKRHLDSFNPQFRQKLLDGSLGYNQVAKFENKYLYPKKTILGLAGWPMPKADFISPTVIVYEKTN